MTIKQYVLDALSKFYTRLKASYVSDCTTDDDELPLAASQGKALQDQIDEMSPEVDKIAAIEANTAQITKDTNHTIVSNSYLDVPNADVTIGNTNRTGESRLHLYTSTRSGRLAATSSTKRLGLWDSTAEQAEPPGQGNWVLVSDVDGTVHIPHTLYIRAYGLSNERPAIASEGPDTYHTLNVAITTSSGVVFQGMWGSTSKTLSNRSISVSASDRRLKENIEPNTKSGLALINALDVVQFDWKDGHGHWDYGIIAQDARELDPNIVIGEENENSYLSIDNLYLIDALVKSVQELTVEVEKLKAEIEILKN